VLALLNPDSLVKSAGYFAIFFLSVLQSCCVPTSSELTLGYGGYLASQGTLSLPGVIAAGTLGEVVGAYIAWVIGKRPGISATVAGAYWAADWCLSSGTSSPCRPAPPRCL
jgi:membrane protein DedA with SNARE-associated domain